MFNRMHIELTDGLQSLSHVCEFTPDDMDGANVYYRFWFSEAGVDHISSCNFNHDTEDHYTYLKAGKFEKFLSNSPQYKRGW